MLSTSLYLLSFLAIINAWRYDQFKRHTNSAIDGYKVFEKESCVSCAFKCIQEEVCMVFSIMDETKGLSKCVLGKKGWRKDIRISDNWSIYANENICNSAPCSSGKCTKYLIENPYLDIFCCESSTTGMKRIANSVYPHVNHYSSSSSNLEQCEERCKKESDCMIANHIEIDDLCNLFSEKAWKFETEIQTTAIQKIAQCTDGSDDLALSSDDSPQISEPIVKPPDSK